MFRRPPALVTLPLLGMMLFVLVGRPLFGSLEPTDPFGDYINLTPGQPTSLLAGYPCTTPYDDTLDRTLYCQIKPDGGPIRLITVTAHDDRIATVSFMTDSLRVGDLVERWGRPDIVGKSKSNFRVKWSSRGVVAVGHTDFWFNYQAVVCYVALYIVRAETPAQVKSDEEKSPA